MLIDMHVHTDRYSDCAHASPEAMTRAAAERGLDGIVITEHDYLWSQTEIDALQQQGPALKILRGVEISTKQGHALVYGMSTRDADAFSWHMELSELTEIAHAAGGIVVLAHPARYRDKIPSEVYKSEIDGVEVLSMNIRRYMADAISTLQSELSLPGIAGTDAHATDSLGFYATDFDHSIETEQDLVKAITTRAFSLYSDDARVAAHNKRYHGEADAMHHLLKAS